MQAVAAVVVWGITVYAVFGLIFAILFVTRGAAKIDPSAVEGSWGFKLLIVPGVAAFWPGLMRRWLSRTAPPVERNPHRDRVGS